MCSIDNSWIVTRRLLIRSRRAASMMGFGRRPQHEQTVRRRGRRSKASQGGNRGTEGVRLQRGSLWGFEDGGQIRPVYVSSAGAGI